MRLLIEKGIPLLSDDLIDLLDKDYPDRHPHLADDDRQIWFKAGQRDVVNRLRQLQAMQKEDEMKKELFE